MKMENGKWKMENGKWKMENGKWKMENGKYGSPDANGHLGLKLKIRVPGGHYCSGNKNF